MIELPDMITIPAGRFVMGTAGDDRFANSTERPAHEAIIDKPFAVSRFPITEAQWAAFADGASSGLPVVRVSWWDATNYVAWQSAQTGRAFRLLTEAEWEYACRAGSTTIFAVGDTLEPEHANYLYDEHGFKVGPGQRTSSGSYAPNAFGIEDMHGNVCEWCRDFTALAPVPPRSGDGLRDARPATGRMSRGGCYAWPASATRLLPVAASRIRTTCPWPTTASLWPSGEKATFNTGPPRLEDSQSRRPVTRS